MLSPVPALLSAKRAAAPTLGRVLAGTLAGGVGGGLIGSALGGDPLRGATQGAAMLGAHGLTARAFKPKPVDPAHRPDLALPGVGQAHVLPKIDMTGVRVPRPRPVTVVQNGKPLSTDDRIYLIPSFENGPTVGGLADRATKMREQTALSAGAAVRDRARDVAERYRTQQQLLIDSQREREVLDAIRTNASNRELVQQAAKANTQRLQGLSDQLAEAHGRSAGLTAGLASAYLAGKGYDALQGQPPVKPEPKKAAELALAVLTKSAVYPGAPGGPAQGYSWGAPSQWATGSGPLGAPQETGVQAKLKALHDRWVEHGDPVAKQQLDAIQQRMAGLTGFSAGGGQPGQTGQPGQIGQPIPPELLRYRALQRQLLHGTEEAKQKQKEWELKKKQLEMTDPQSPDAVKARQELSRLDAEGVKSKAELDELERQVIDSNAQLNSQGAGSQFWSGFGHAIGIGGSSVAENKQLVQKLQQMKLRYEATRAEAQKLRGQHLATIDAARKQQLEALGESPLAAWEAKQKGLSGELGGLTQQYEGLDEYDAAHSNMQAAMAALGKDRHDELAQQEYQAARQNMAQLMQQYKTRQRPAAPMPAVGGGLGSAPKPSPVGGGLGGTPPVPSTPPVPAQPPAQGVSAHGIGGGVGSLPTPMPGPSGGKVDAAGGGLVAKGSFVEQAVKAVRAKTASARIADSAFADVARLCAELMVPAKAAGSVVPVALGITAGQRRPEVSPIPIIPPDKDDVSPDGLSRAEQVMAALNAGKIRKKKKKPAVTAE